VLRQPDEGAHLQAVPMLDCTQPGASAAQQQLWATAGAAAAAAICAPAALTGSEAPVATCLQAACIDGAVHIELGGQSHTCPEGATVTLQTPAGTVTAGPCPPAEQICPYKGCPVKAAGLCSSRGWCLEGACHCNLDAEGAACERLLCASGQDCLSGYACVDSACMAANAEVTARWRLFEAVPVVRTLYSCQCAPASVLPIVECWFILRTVAQRDVACVFT
jgi:hypothetical protein